MNPWSMEDYKNERHIHIRYKIEADHMFVLSQLKDEHHDIQVFFRISTLDYKIAEVQGKMNVKPFNECPGSLSMLQGLIGLKIGVGVKKEYFKRFAKREGCTHVTEIFLATVDYIFARLYGTEQMSTEAEKNRRRRLGAEILCQNDSCHIFNQENLKNFDENGRYQGKNYNY